MKEKSLFLTLILLVLSLLLLAISTYAWIIARPSLIENIIVQTGNLEIDASLEYRINGGDYRVVHNNLVIANIVPGDQFDFKLTVYNKSTIEGNLNVNVRDITRSIIEPNIDMASVLILYSDDEKIPTNKTILELIKNSDSFHLLTDQLAVQDEPFIYYFSIMFDVEAGNEYQGKYLKIGQIEIRYDQ